MLYVLFSIPTPVMPPTCEMPELALQAWRKISKLAETRTPDPIRHYEVGY